MLEVVGVQGRIEGVRELGGRGQGREEAMLEVKMESMEVKREIMRQKGKLKGRKERIGDDLTWKERKMQWQLRAIGEEEERKGKRVRVKYGKIEIEGKTWFWDEQGEVLRGIGEGRKGEGQKGEQKRGEKEKGAEKRWERQKRDRELKGQKTKGGGGEKGRERTSGRKEKLEDSILECCGGSKQGG